MKEEWRPLSKQAFGNVAEFYEVSNLGVVRSKTRKDKSGRTRKGRVLKGWLSKGYLVFTAYGENKKKQIKVHQAVYYSFKGGKPSQFNMVIDHIDENKTNNRLDNLQLLTHFENISKSIAKYDLPKHISAKPAHWDSSKLVYQYQRYICGKNKCLKQSVSLDNIIKFKQQYENKEFESKQLTD
jgi:hypothetical protein